MLRIAALAVGLCGAFAWKELPQGDPASLQAAISASIAAGEVSFRVPPAAYRFPPRTALTIASAMSWSMDASGSAFIFACGFGVKFVSVSNISTRNVLIDYDPPCFAQGSVVAWKPGNATPGALQNATVDVELDPGFPAPVPEATPIFGARVVKLVYWDGGNSSMVRWQTGVNNWIGVAAVAGKPNTFRAILPPRGIIPPPGAADLRATLSPRVGFTHLCVNCSASTFQGTRVYGGGNMIYVEQGGGGGNRYSNVSITRRPGSTHLLSGNADAFHSSCARRGPILEDSELAFTGDDLINVHSKIGLVWGPCPGSEQPCTEIIDTSGFAPLNFGQAARGDVLRFYDLHSLAHLGDEVLQADAAVEANATEQREAAAAPSLITRPPFSSRILPFSVTLVRAPLALPQGAGRFSLVQFDGASGAGAVIRRNWLHDGFVTVAKLKSINASMTENLMQRSRGVHIAAEELWLEGSLGLRNVTVASNIIEACGTAEQAITEGRLATDLHIFNNSITPGPP